MVPVRMVGPWVSRSREISLPRLAARVRREGATWRTKSWLAWDIFRRKTSAPPSRSCERAEGSVCCGPRVAMSFVLRAKGSFHIGVEVAEVAATTVFSLIMEEKEDEDVKCCLS